MGIMITCHGCNSGYNSPMYNAHRNTSVHYTWQNTVICNLWVSGMDCVDLHVENFQHLPSGFFVLLSLSILIKTPTVLRC